MKEDDSMLAIFQDPLLIIIALILINTLSMIIPDESEPGPSQTYAANSEMNSINMSNRRIAHDLEKLRRASKSLENELESLKKQIEDVRAEPPDSKNLENATRLEERIQRLTAEAEAKEKEIKRIEDRLKDAQHAASLSGDKETDLQKMTHSLRQQLDKLKRDNVSELEHQVASDQHGGFTTVSESDKEATYFELVKNRLYPVNEEYYDKVVGYIELDSGKKVDVVGMTRKSGKAGESIKELNSLKSDFQETFKNLNPEEERIIFLLHGDSFEVFRKARDIAREKGIELGWWPFERESITFGSSDAEGSSIGSTENSRNR